MNASETKLSSGELVVVLVVLSIIAVACIYFDYWAFIKIHPEASAWLWVLDCVRK